MKRRILSILLALCIMATLLSTLPTQVFAAPYPQSTMDAIVKAWNETSYSKNEESKYEGAEGCAAFSRYAFFQLYGHTDHPSNSNNTSKKVTCETPEQLLNNLLAYAAPGDAFRVETPETGYTYQGQWYCYTHIMNLYDITTDYKIKVYQSNWSDGSENKADAHTFANVTKIVTAITYDKVTVENGEFTAKVTLQIIHAKDNPKTYADFTGVTPTYNLYCHNNYSGKNYLYGTDFTGPLNSNIIYSRDESVTTVSTDQTTTHNGYGSLKIVNTSAGASGKDLAIVTLTNDREANGNIADNKEMTLSFWAKASNADTKIYFRWGYGTYNSVTLTKDWAYYTIPMNKIPSYGSSMHPYVDRAGTVWIAEMQLEDGTAATAFVPENTNPINHAILEQSLGQKYQLPADPVREGYTFAGWYTANRGGTRITANTTVLEGDLIVYAHWDSDCTHQYQSSVVTAATCTEEGLIRYTCSLCGDSYTEIQPALGHSFGAWSHVDGSNPSTHSRKCSRCNEIETENCSFTNGSCTVCKFNPNVEAKLIVSHTRGAAGTTVTVDVSLEKNPGIVSAYLDLNYDTTKLTLTNAEDTGLLKGGLFSNDYTTVPFALNWDDSLATTNNTANGVIAKLTFQIKEDCPEGTVPVTLSFAQGNIIDKDLNNVDFMAVDGAVEVVDYILGDVDGDGQILAKDVAALRRYLAHWSGITIIEPAADVNKDSNITAQDVAILRRYLAHWTGVTLAAVPAPQTATRSILHRGANDPTIKISSAESNVGDQVTLNVDLLNNPGIVSAYLDLSYDNTKLKLISVEDTELLKGALFSNDYAIIPFALNWDDSIASANNTGSGTIAKLTFEILEGCQSAPATVSISYVDGNILNYDLNNVDFVVESGTVSVHVHQYAEAVTAPTCTEQGYTTYTCACGDSYVDDYIDATGHDWNVPSYEWSADYSKVTAKRICKNDENHVESETVTTTSEVTKPATTEEKGETTYTAVFTNSAFTTQTKTVANIDIIGLEWAEPTYVWSDDNSTVTASRVCTNKDDLIETETVNTTSEVTKPATCTEKGETTYTAEFENGAFVKQTKTVENLDALGHDWNEPTYVWAEDNSTVTASRTCKRDESHVETETVNTTSVTQAATVDAEGQTVYTAVFENEAFETQTKTVILPKLDPTDPCADGHDWGEPTYVWAEDNSTVTATRVCKNNAEHAETETVNTTSEVTKEATVDEEGEITYTATFTNPAFETQTKKVATPKLEPHEPSNPFEDVVEGKFYYDAVLWAVAHEPQITNGTDATHFSPDATCTRGQVVTFLWRAKGCPEPTKTDSPFTDVTGGFYYKAVLWAVENEITNGTSATTFGPNDGCTRGQVVTFLWRTEGKPEPTTENNPFEDVTGGFYYKAVLWAVENKITAGMDATHFAPMNTCTRGQIVTFLYRDLASK